MAEGKRWAHDDLEFARALTFFDAIFAFSVTLLITTVDDFDLSAWTSPQALLDANGSSLLAFTISFIVVIAFWRANHRMYSEFTAIDSLLLMLTAAAMFWIVLIPFSTEALGAAELGGQPLPTAVYAVNIVVAYLTHWSVPVVADFRRLRRIPLTSRERLANLIAALPLPVIFLGSIPVAYLVSPTWAQRSWMLVWPVLALVGPVLDRWAKADAPRG